MPIDDLQRMLTDKVAQAGRLGGAPLGKVAKFDLGDAGVLVLDATESPAAVTREDRAADCTLQLAAADLERILDGDLDATAAFMAGRLQFKGDMGVAMQLAALLG
jgi:putative sterol carrier protein